MPVGIDKRQGERAGEKLAWMRERVAMSEFIQQRRRDPIAVMGSGERTDAIVISVYFRGYPQRELPSGHRERGAREAHKVRGRILHAQCCGLTT